MDVIYLKPVFKQMVWGGSRMKDKYGYDIPGMDTGECWAVSAHPNGDCEVANGDYAGMKLSELYASHRELFGNVQDDCFPLLTKVIDAKADLSIQVHPDDAYANEKENGSHGKMECWYILDCEEDSTIVIGHHAKTKEELCSMVEQGQWKELIREIPIKKGDFFQINPGCVHAIKGGTMILESQQNSDITYRLYDYDRLQNGVKRPLHIAQSLDVIKVPFEENVSSQKATETKNKWFEHLVTCQYYSVWKAKLHGKEVLCQDQNFLIGSVIEGAAVLDGQELKSGTHFIVPFGAQDISIEGDAELIFSTAL